MASPHGKSVCSLPLRIPGLKCSCPDQREAARVCLGCYGHYCIPCYQQHRRQISDKLDHIIHESDIVLQAMLPTFVQDKQNRVFNPVQLRNEIHDCQDKLITDVKRTTRGVLKSLRTLMDERSDYLASKCPPITDCQLKSWRDFKNYMATHEKPFIELLRTANDRLEEESTTEALVSMEHARDIDWRYLIELQQVQQTRSRRRPPTGIINEPHFEYLSKGYKPFKTIIDQEDGNAISASDHLIIYALGGRQLSLVESHADYRTIIPLSHDADSVEKLEDVIDLCWSSATALFIVLTHTQFFTLSPNRKIPTLLSNIQPPRSCTFCSCTCSGNKVLISYTNGKSSSIQQYFAENWRQERCWSSPDFFEEGKDILCIRFTSSGDHVGMTLVATKKEARFELRDSNTMSCVWFRVIPATSCISIVPFTDTIWLVGVFCYHKIFLVIKDHVDIQEIVMTDPQKATLRGMTLVDQGTVVIRTASTVIFFDLFHKI